MLTEAVHIWWYIFFSWRTDELKDEAVRRVEWKVTNDVLDEDTFQPSKSDYYYFVLLSFLSYSFLLTFFENKWRWCFCMNTHWLAQWVILLPSLNFRIHFCKLAFLRQHHQQQHKNTGIKNGNKPESQKAKTFRIARIFAAKTFRIKRVKRVDFQIRDKCAEKVVLQDFVHKPFPNMPHRQCLQGRSQIWDLKLLTPKTSG